MAVHLAAARGCSPDATETQKATRSRRRRARAARLASGPGLLRARPLARGRRRDCRLSSFAEVA
jgi:hypothetical protein